MLVDGLLTVAVVGEVRRSCSATNATAPGGTASGSLVRDIPSIRTVPHCTAHPSLVAGRRLAAKASSAARSSRKNCSSSASEGSSGKRS
nr:hypothetical protein [Nonomuraea cypriaca]